MFYCPYGKWEATVICIEEPLREEASAVVNSLKKAGLSKVVMMTGDSERTAAAIAKRVGGVIMPTTSALLHNTSTLYIGLKSMGNLLN